MRNLTLKYDFNKKYYYNKPISIPHIESCLYCNNGKHKRFADNVEVNCPVCNGTGKIDTKSGSIKEEPRLCFLSMVSAKITKNNEDISYIFVDEDGFTTFGNVYEDIDECINNQSKSIMGYTS